MTDEFYKKIQETLSQNDNAGFGRIAVKLHNDMLEINKRELSLTVRKENVTDNEYR